MLNGNVQRKDTKTQTETKAENGENNEPIVLRKRKREAIDSLVGEIFSTTVVKSEPDVPLAEQTVVAPQPGVAAMDAVSVHAEAAATGEESAPSNGINRESVLPDLLNESRPRPSFADPSRKQSMLHSSRATSFTAVEPSKPQLTSARPAQIISVLPSLPAAVTPISLEAGNSLGTPSQFFSGLTFSHNISEQCEGLEKALVVHGGSMVTEQERSDGTLVDFVVVRL